MMATIDKHILDIVNNKDSVKDFCQCLWDEDDFIEYIDEIEDYRPLFDGYHYDYNTCRWEIMCALSTYVKEHLFNDSIIKSITDADKHNILKFLMGECVKPYCDNIRDFIYDISRDTITNDYLEDNWESLICDFVYLKVYNMVLNEDGWLQDNIISTIEDSVRDKVQEKISRKIAIEKIASNKLFVLGLSKKLSMRDCGIPLSA